MTKNWRWLLVGGGLLLAALIVLPSQGCGGDDDDDNATVSGNVSSVTDPPAAMAPARSRWLAFLNVFGASEAVAQACTAEDVFFCLDNGTNERCTQVSESSCLFTLSIDVDDELSARFVKDEDEDGVIDATDASAELTDPGVDICPGVVVTLDDVDIDFSADPPTATADSAESTGCAEPTATPTSDGTATPTPTAGDTPTPTPTETPAP
ncbi:MAG: hypothetical protein ACREQ9_05945 [Candidatus Binatia bacterium]